MRALGVIAATTLGCCAAAMLTASPGAAAGGFAGSWIATDTLDGSRLSLSVRGGGGHYAVREVDSAATVCGGAPASVTGPGTVDGDVLVVPVTLVCLPGGNILRERIVISFTYRPGTDSLIDNDGVVWRRAS